jgi:hypothetical protein
MAGNPPVKARPAPKPTSRSGKAKPVAARKPGGLFSGKAAVKAL